MTNYEQVAREYFGQNYITLESLTELLEQAYRDGAEEATERFVK